MLKKNRLSKESLSRSREKYYHYKSGDFGTNRLNSSNSPYRSPNHSAQLQWNCDLGFDSDDGGKDGGNRGVKCFEPHLEKRHFAGAGVKVNYCGVLGGCGVGIIKGWEKREFFG